jgi:hypothetical protein
MADGRRSRSEHANGDVLATRFLRLLAQLSDRELEALAVTDPRSTPRLMSNQTRSPTKGRTAIAGGVRAGPERGRILR